MVSNEDLKQALPGLTVWWSSKTPAEKAWYRKFWASCAPKN